MRPGKYRTPDKTKRVDQLVDQIVRPQGRNPRQGRASLSFDHAPARARQGALPQLEGEHCSTQDAGRAVGPVDGSQ